MNSASKFTPVNTCLSFTAKNSHNDLYLIQKKARTVHGVNMYSHMQMFGHPWSSDTFGCFLK